MARGREGVRMTREDKLKVCDKLLTAPTAEDHGERLRLAQLMRDEAALKSNVGRHKIEWSEEASVATAVGRINAFQRNSYIARVTMKDGRIVLVVLPPNAREHGYREYITAVLAAADAAQDGDVRFVS